MTDAYTLQPAPHRSTYRFGLDEPEWDGDLARLSDRIASQPNSDQHYRFARDVPGVDVARFQALIMAIPRYWLQFLFARDVPGAYRPSLQESILSGHDAHAQQAYAEWIPDADRDRLQSAVLAGCDPYAHIDFASRVIGADVPVCVARILTTGDGYALYRAAIRLPAHRDAFQAALLRMNNPGAQYEFAAQVGGADRVQLGRAIHASGDARFQALFAQIPG